MSQSLALFSVAKEALAEARRIDEIKDVRDQAERIQLYGQQANDRTIIADATEIIMRAEMRLGELLQSAHETGQLGVGRPSRSNVEGLAEGEEEVAEERPTRVTLKEAGISKALSRRAQQLAAADPEQREELISKTRDKILSGSAVVVNPMRDLSAADKKARRADREKSLAAKMIALPEAKFGVIYADPEWRFKTRSTETGMDRSADNHYPTSELEAIKTRDVPSLAADDCALFLWATVPMLPEALEVMDAWGFKYVSQFCWDKEHIGTGYWTRNQHELLLIGTRGAIPAPAMGEQFPSLIRAPATAHSAKPEIFHEIIEAYYPNVPKIELNARVARPGWARWGYEAPEPAEGAGAVTIEAVANPAPADPEQPAHTFETAKPILIERYASEPGKKLAEELGVPVNTVRGWAFKLGLTSKARISAMAIERNKAAAK